MLPIFTKDYEIQSGRRMYGIQCDLLQKIIQNTQTIKVADFIRLSGLQSSGITPNHIEVGSQSHDLLNF